MARYRHKLPQLDGGQFLTDGGLETWLIYHYGLQLREFSAYETLATVAGRRALDAYYRPFIELADTHSLGFILESPTWRANEDWGGTLGYGRNEIDAFNHQAIAYIEQLRASAPNHHPIVLSGNIGPRGDGYDPGKIMSFDMARQYHSRQIEVFESTEADMVTALTLTNVEEAMGLTQAANDCDMPIVIAFTLELDGKLPTGQPLGEAIETVDSQVQQPPVYYMINCAHPDHFMTTLSSDQQWTSRIRGVRANASRMSHAELDVAAELDEGNPEELGQLYQSIRTLLPNLAVLGGCCGTDVRHVEHMCRFASSSANAQML